RHQHRGRLQERGIGPRILIAVDRADRHRGRREVAAQPGDVDLPAAACGQRGPHGNTARRSGVEHIASMVSWPPKPALSDPGGMMRKALFVALVFATSTDFAMHCPKDMKAIDDALAKKPQLSAAQMEEVKKYRAEGEALHKAGKHQESVDTLAKAMKILGI